MDKLDHNMAPEFPISDKAHMPLGYSVPKVFPDLFLSFARGKHLEHGSNFGLFESSARVFLAKGSVSLPLGVFDVRHVSIPSQVLKACVFGFAVVMATLHSGRARAKESCSHKRVNVVAFWWKRGVVEAHNRIPRHGIFSRAKNPLFNPIFLPTSSRSFNRQNSTHIANHVDAFISSNITPFFCGIHELIITDLEVPCQP